MLPIRRPITIPVQPWFRDHAFGGKAVLPAVETMSLLAGVVADCYPEMDSRVMTGARFARFLELPHRAAAVEALVEIECSSDTSSLCASLLTRKTSKTISRLQEHGEVRFSASPGREPSALPAVFRRPDSYSREIPAEEIYRRMVPFGPAYQSLTGSLQLGENSARGMLRAPDRPTTAIQKRIGSPFPLDGAMHAACVLGQQHVDFIPFPVAFDQRIIFRPTLPKGKYSTKVVLVSREAEELTFDLVISGSGELVHETVTGIRMRNVGLKKQDWN